MRWSGRLRKGGTPASMMQSVSGRWIPEGFFCAEKDGKIVATAAVVNYDDRFSFGGFYIVDPDTGSTGSGCRSARHAMRHAGSRIVGVDGVVAMVEKYEKSGGSLPSLQ